ncbi:MAG: orotidine-5'-phosphate decarboxylase [Ignavibacteriales bacterium]|nr:orotidine-5'-phosphate decarboxylase [Ignavibacteriales bacterium]
MTAQEKLFSRLKEGKHICVGLDTDISKIPMYLHQEDHPILKFNKIIIDNTAAQAAAYKINFAFYERDGAAGIDVLHKTIEYIPQDILIIGDAKRGDIGNTSEMYAYAMYNRFMVDAATLSPYMGYDSLEPFLRFNDKINFILALTSNFGANDFEKLELKNGCFLFQKVIGKANEWNTNKNCGIVFGATNLDELKNNVDSFMNLFVLLPGVGAQGGSLDEVVNVFKQNNFNNFLINVSRALIYKDKSMEFGKKAKEEIINLNASINKIWNS